MYKDDDYFFDEVDKAISEKYGSSERNKSRKPLSRKEIAMRKKQQLLERKRKRRKKMLKIVFSVLAIIVLFVCFLAFTKPGNKLVLRFASNYAKNQMNNDDKIVFTPPKVIPEGWSYDEDVVNVLLVGIEQNGGANNTDSMILVSENLKSGQITAVSFLRDTYLMIDGLGYKQKLNYAYSHGDGMSTLINTIQNQYHIYINAYATVDYSGFESIIDKLGGVDIELSSEEANYLNSTNYISDPSNRNVVAGMNHFNGNQALGYSRVRKVATVEGVNDDYGRTLRQRKVLNCVFEKYKSQSITSLVSTTNSILGMMTTNLTSDQIYCLLSGYVDNKSEGLNQLMIPANGYFTPGNTENAGSSLLIDGFEQDNIDILREALYSGD